MTFDQALSQIKEQQWYQQIDSTYQQLPDEQKQWVKWGGLGIAAFLFIYFTFSLVSEANQAKSDYYEKQELLQVVNQATDELRRLKGQNSGFSQQTGTQNWKTIFQTLMSNQSQPPANIEITKETAGPVKSVIQETLLDVQMKSISLRPLVQLLYQVEHGSPPMKIRAIKIDSNPSEGNLNVQLSVSGFVTKAETTPTKGDKK